MALLIKTGDEWNPEWTWQDFRSAQRSERSQASAAFIVLASSVCQITRATEETDDPQPFLLYSARMFKKRLDSLAKCAPNLALRWNWPSWCIFPSFNYRFFFTRNYRCSEYCVDHFSFSVICYPWFNFAFNVGELMGGSSINLWAGSGPMRDPPHPPTAGRVGPICCQIMLDMQTQSKKPWCTATSKIIHHPTTRQTENPPKAWRDRINENKNGETQWDEPRKIMISPKVKVDWDYGYTIRWTMWRRRASVWAACKSQLLFAKPPFPLAALRRVASQTQEVMRIRRTLYLVICRRWSSASCRLDLNPSGGWNLDEKRLYKNPRRVFESFRQCAPHRIM